MWCATRWGLNRTSSARSDSPEQSPGKVVEHEQYQDDRHDQDVDPALREAAKGDGANERQTFLRVVFPVMAPINVVIVVVTTIVGGEVVFER